jgi:hypothetical protein
MSESVMRLLGREIANVLTNENILLHAKRDRIFQMRADRENSRL